MIQGNIEYQAEDLESFPDGTVREAILARDTVIQGLPCAGGHDVVFFPCGKVRLAYLSRQTTIDGINCAPGIVYLHERGSLLNAALAADVTFFNAQITEGARVTLAETGTLLEYSRRLSKDEIVSGFPCAAQFNVWHYASGRLSSAVLVAPIFIAGAEFPRGTELFLSDDGQLLESNLVDLDSGKQYKQRVFGVYEAHFE